MKQNKSGHFRAGKKKTGTVPKQKRFAAMELDPFKVHEPVLPRPEKKPEILAPAGNMASALAAFAAGADAVYLGLKSFSARMLADNFSITDLARLTDLAHAEKKRVYVAMNTFIKPGECAKALRQIARFAKDVSPDALIIQDLGLALLAREAGFSGSLHFSTLANASHAAAFPVVLSAGADRLVLPRELCAEEIQAVNRLCPQGLSLEVFVHGALCYCVSGRCWWSSYLGGKSGLRGRCVQPCRRVYTQGKRQGRFFSCLDLSLADKTRELLPLDKISAWKIEGRRKGPHYVYHVSKAYVLLRDDGDSPAARREAADLLDLALGRPGTDALFIRRSGSGNERQQAASPLAMSQGKKTQTGSGLLCALIRDDGGGKSILQATQAMQSGDYLRIGYEDEPWHFLYSLKENIQKEQEIPLATPPAKIPPSGTPVFLIDRLAPALRSALLAWEKKLPKNPRIAQKDRQSAPELYPAVYGGVKNVSPRFISMELSGFAPGGKEPGTPGFSRAVTALWLGKKTAEHVSKTLAGRIVWWLPPVIWPSEEAHWQRLIRLVLQKGAVRFVCNAPWQCAFFQTFRNVRLTAGPFCNISNPHAVKKVQDLGFEQAVVSPELGQEDLLCLPGQSPLPLGIVLSGFWPVGISRHTFTPFNLSGSLASPKKELFWIRRYGQNLWLYPSWPLDLTARRAALLKAGYGLFITMTESSPAQSGAMRRSGQFNWENDVL